MAGADARRPRGAVHVMVTGARDTARIVVRSLDTGIERDLVVGTNPRLSPTGQILFARAGELWAVPFDRNRLAITGVGDARARRAAGQLRRNGVVCDGHTTARSSMPRPAGQSSSRVTAPAGPQVLLDVPRVYDGVPQPSPDGHRLVMAFSDHFGVQPHHLDLRSRTPSDQPAHVWQKPGYGPAMDAGRPTNRVQLQSCGRHTQSLLDGRRRQWRPGATHQRSSAAQTATSWTGDGRVLAFTETHPTSGRCASIPRRQPEPFLRTPYKESAAALLARWPVAGLSGRTTPAGTKSTCARSRRATASGRYQPTEA